MIISCPACSTRYVVPDTAIGVDGRTVRCAKCRHSWHQDGQELDLADLPQAATISPEPPPPPQQPSPHPESENPPPAETGDHEADDVRPGFTGAHRHEEPRLVMPDKPAPQPAEATPAPVSPIPAADEDPYIDPYDDEVSQFDRRPPFRPRRNPLKIWTAAGAVFALLAFGTVFAVSYFGVPDWLPVSRPTFALAQPDLVLDFPADKQDRRTLPDGSEFFSASGTITNTGRETRKVPSILIVMRNEREVPVYSWVLVPPKSALAPGESVSINEIATDVPKSAKIAEIGWNPS